MLRRPFGGSASTWTVTLSMRGSHKVSACWTRYCASAIVVGLIGSNIRPRKPAPKVGRITRSPGSVPRMMRIACSTSSPYEGVAIASVVSTAIGNAQPVPRNALLSAGVAIVVSAADIDGWDTGFDLGAAGAQITDSCGGLAAELHRYAA